MVHASEADILKACMDWLSVKGYCAWRVPLGAILRSRSKDRVVFSKNPIKGFPDVCGVLKNAPGKMFVIEIKSATGRIAPMQKAWHERLAAAGVLVIVARSLHEIIASLCEAEANLL